MRPPIALIADFEPDRVCGWRQATVLSQRALLANAMRLARTLRGERRVINLCDDRINFVLGYVATLIAGATTLLPPSRAPHAVAALGTAHLCTTCLVDHDDAPFGLRVVPVSAHAGEAFSGAVPPISAEHPAAMLFTSGSTGTPAATVKTWGALVDGAETFCSTFAIGGAEPASIVGTIPAQHMFGLESTVMPVLQNGLKVDAGRPLLPADVAAAFGNARNGWLMTTPLHLRACVEADVRIPGLRGIVSSTMPLAQSLAARAEAMYHVPVYELYGCTEAGMVATRRTASSLRWSLARGVSAWQDGETTWIQGGHVQDPVRLADSIELHDTSQFSLHGRITDIVKVAGKRTSLAALNAELAAIDGVADGVFFLPAPADSRQITRLQAFVIAPSLSRAQILAALRSRIDPVFLPRPLHLVDALPRNATGKLPLEALEELARQVSRRSQ